MKTRIPIKVFKLDPTSYHIKCEAIVNGEKMILLIDTGASRTVFDMDLSSKFNHEVKEHSSVTSGVGSNEIKSYAAKIKSLQLGKLTIKNYESAFIDFTHIHAAYEMAGVNKIYGIIGGDILKKYKAIINYGSKTMTLEKK